MRDIRARTLKYILNILIIMPLCRTYAIGRLNADENITEGDECKLEAVEVRVSESIRPDMSVTRPQRDHRRTCP